jgi:hypothetical protein
MREYIHEPTLPFNDPNQLTTNLLVGPHLARESHISLTVTVLISMLLSVPKSTLVTRIIILPRLIAILERNRIVIPAFCLNLHGIR